MTKSDDNHEKIQAMQLFKDTHLVKLELLSITTTIDSALSYIRTKQEQQEQQSKKTQALQMGEISSSSTTTNQIF